MEEADDPVDSDGKSFIIRY